MLFNNNRQKSPQRRFLLILGVTVFIAVVTFGLMVIFWDKMLSSIPHTQKILYGIVIIIYAFIRFSRLLKRGDNEKDDA
jgi:hypothetical protein